MPEFFADALEQLQEAFPQFWAHREPRSELAIHLQVLAEIVDEFSELAEGIHADQSLQTARHEALLSEWALLWGAENEQLPLTEAELRTYLQARAGDDGSERALIVALLALLTPANPGDPGTTLTFPVDGSGLTLPLTFPANPWLVIVHHQADKYIEVRVLETLTFDRPAFGRIVQRFRPSHYLPSVVTETAAP